MTTSTHSIKSSLIPYTLLLFISFGLTSVINTPLAICESGTLAFTRPLSCPEYTYPGEGSHISRYTSISFPISGIESSTENPSIVLTLSVAVNVETTLLPAFVFNENVDVTPQFTPLVTLRTTASSGILISSLNSASVGIVVVTSLL